MRQHFERVGEAAIRALLGEIEGHDTVERTLVPTELVVRESSGPPR